jgi:SMI1 / KNR4 family (SUKH-1)
MAASEAQIAEVEHHFGVRLPDDYRHFVRTRGTMGEFLPPANSYVTIYPIEEIISVNESAFIRERFPGAVVIGGDGSRERLTYDFRNPQPRLVLLDIAAEDWSEAIHQASTLTTLLAQLPVRGWLFE